MSMQYVFSIHEQDFTMQCPDSHVLEKLFTHDSENMQNIFGLEAEERLIVGTPTAKVPSNQLIESIDKLLLVLQTKKDIIPYTYRVQCQALGSNSSSKGIGGIRFPGDEEYAYSLFAKENTCVLGKWVIKDDGQGFCIEEQDVGHLKNLMTSNLGEIKILKRRQRLPLSSDLKKLKEFLQKTDHGIVTKRLV